MSMKISFLKLKLGTGAHHTVDGSSGNMHSTTLQWRHNGLEGVSNYQHSHCLLSRLFGRRSKKTPKLRVTGLCVGNSPGTGEFPAQMASNAENVSISWRQNEPAVRDYPLNAAKGNSPVLKNRAGRFKVHCVRQYLINVVLFRMKDL